MGEGDKGVRVEFSSVPTVLQGLPKCLTLASGEEEEEKGFVRVLSSKAYTCDLSLVTPMNHSILGSVSTNTIPPRSQGVA